MKALVLIIFANIYLINFNWELVFIFILRAHICNLFRFKLLLLCCAHRTECSKCKSQRVLFCSVQKVNKLRPTVSERMSSLDQLMSLKTPAFSMQPVSMRLYWRKNKDCDNLRRSSAFKFFVSKAKLSPTSRFFAKVLIEF